MELFAWISIGTAILSLLVLVIAEVRRPQKMAVMNVVWPVTALYFSLAGVWAYFSLGRKGGTDHKTDGPTMAQAAVGTSHCGAGCMIADVICAFAIAACGFTLWGSVLWAEFAVELGAAWALGIVFQYLAIRPMRTDLSAGAAVLAAIKADTLSILAFQVGMYSWMALVYFKFFTAPHLTVLDPRYWLMMQVGMVCGFATSLPMNWLLLRWKLKEPM